MALLAAGVAVFLWQGDVTAARRAELAQLQREAGELARLEATHRELLGASAEVVDLRRRARELASSREEIAAVQAQIAAELAAAPSARAPGAKVNLSAGVAPWF